jgi:hypothetical protein
VRQAAPRVVEGADREVDLALQPSRDQLAKAIPRIMRMLDGLTKTGRCLRES